MKIIVTLPGRPVPWSRAARGKRRSYTPVKQAAHKNALSRAIQEQAKGKTLSGPISVYMQFDYTAEGKTLIEIREMPDFFGGYTSIPDIDNLEKQVLDAIQFSGVIGNDSQVVRTEAEKVKFRDES